MLVRDPVAMRKHELVGADGGLLRARADRAPDLRVLDARPRLHRLGQSEPLGFRVADAEEGRGLALPEAAELAALDLHHRRIQVGTRRRRAAGAAAARLRLLLPEGASGRRRRPLRRARRGGAQHLSGGSSDPTASSTIRRTCCLSRLGLQFPWIRTWLPHRLILLPRRSRPHRVANHVRNRSAQQWAGNRAVASACHPALWRRLRPHARELRSMTVSRRGRSFRALHGRLLPPPRREHFGDGT